MSNLTGLSPFPSVPEASRRPTSAGASLSFYFGTAAGSDPGLGDHSSLDNIYFILFSFWHLYFCVLGSLSLAWTFPGCPIGQVGGPHQPLGTDVGLSR